MGVNEANLTEQELLILRLWDSMLQIRSRLWTQHTWIDPDTKKLTMPPWFREMDKVMSEEYDKISDIKRRGIYG